MSRAWIGVEAGEEALFAERAAVGALGVAAWRASRDVSTAGGRACVLVYGCVHARVCMHAKTTDAFNRNMGASVQSATAKQAHLIPDFQKKLMKAASIQHSTHS